MLDVVLEFDKRDDLDSRWELSHADDVWIPNEIPKLG